MNDRFKALSDPTRRKILEMLRRRDLSAGEIAAQFNISKPSISHHLTILKNVDLVSSEKDGQSVIYSLNTSVLDNLMHWFYMLFEGENKND